MVVAAVVVGVATVGGAAISASGTKSAAAAQTSAAQSQIALANNEFTAEQSNLKPYNAAGQSALQTLTAGLQPGGQFSAPNANNFTNSPGYAASVAAGQGAIMQSAAARGQSLSPSTLGALGQYTANASLQDYNTWYSQQLSSQSLELGGLEDLTGVGEGAAAGTNAALTTATGQQINALGSIGNAQAASDTGTAAAYGGALSSLGQDATNYYSAQYYNSLFNSPGGGSSWVQTNPGSSVPSGVYT